MDQLPYQAVELGLPGFWDHSFPSPGPTVPLYKYVDDSTLFEICNTTDVSVMQESIDRAVNWTNNNCMKINSNKSKEMVICFTPDENVRNSIPSIMLYQLKRAGISQLDLVTVYISVVRPVLEYACAVWHTNLPKYLSDSIQLIQNRALKSIFPGKSYNDILNETGLRTLKERRDVLCMKYFAEI